MNIKCILSTYWLLFFVIWSKPFNIKLICWNNNIFTTKIISHSSLKNIFNMITFVTLYFEWVYLQQLGLSTQAFGAELHDRIRAEGVSNTILTQCAQPQGQWDLQFHRRNQDGLVTRVHTAQYKYKYTVAWTHYTLISTQITRCMTWTKWWVYPSVTSQDTREQNQVRSTGRGRWRSGVRSRAHTAAL